MVQIASTIALISLIANIISNIALTNLLLNTTMEDFLKEPPKSMGYIIAVAFVSKFTFYISLTLTMAALISRFLL